MDRARYAALAEARGRLLTEAAQRVPLASMAQQGRALSLWTGRRIEPLDELQLGLVLDLGVLDPLGGHGRGIDRQAAAEPPPPGSIDGIMVDALRTAPFALIVPRGPHPEGWSTAEYLHDGTKLRIADAHLDRNPPGAPLAARLCWPAPEAGAPPVAMLCGVLAPVDAAVLRAVLSGQEASRDPVIPRGRYPDDAQSLAELLATAGVRERLTISLGLPGVAARFWRAAIDEGLLGPIAGRTPPELMPRRPPPA